MVNIETIDLTSRNVVLPSDRVGIVVAQPFLSLTAAEPFRCTAAAKPQQLQILKDTLTVAREARHGGPKTHFTVFPEYSIPGFEGIATVEAALSAQDWPNGTIVIGGVDALSKDEFVQLANAARTHLDTAHNALDRVAGNAWVNCGITWVKSGDGVIDRWLQPKLHPAWPEMNVHFQDMFRGSSVFTFTGPFDNGTHYRFCSIICFDWVATVDQHKVWRWVLEELHRQAGQAELPFSWCFVIQCNEKPSHDTFLTEVTQFFNQTLLPNVRRDRACVLFANTAGKGRPGKAESYGSTSLVFSPQSLFAKPECHPTFLNDGRKFRSSTLLSAHCDVVFRERGACIHSFLQVNPASLAAGAAGRSFPVENAFVYPLGGLNDPRAPGASVAAGVKWLNDELDHIPSLGRSYTAVPLATASDTAHDQTIASLRVLSPQAAFQTVKLATQQTKAKHADQWEQAECQAVEHLVHTLDILSIGSNPPAVGAGSTHATITLNNQTVDLIAIRGESHEACLTYGLPSLSRRQCVLVSRDPDNNPWSKRFGSFLQPETPRLGAEPNITDPASGLLHLGYRNLLDIFQHTATVGAVAGAIDAELSS